MKTYFLLFIILFSSLFLLENKCILYVCDVCVCIYYGFLSMCKKDDDRKPGIMTFSLDTTSLPFTAEASSTHYNHTH